MITYGLMRCKVKQCLHFFALLGTFFSNLRNNRIAALSALSFNKDIPVFLILDRFVEPKVGGIADITPSIFNEKSPFGFRTVVEVSPFLRHVMFSGF